MTGFRVWSDYWKRYSFDAELYADGSLYAMFEDDDGVPHHENTDLVLEFDTDLKDKNGKEIYEGDIVTLNGECEEIEYSDCSIVTFENGCFRVGEGYENEAGSYLSDWRIIGNIHENPELVAKEKE